MNALHLAFVLGAVALDLTAARALRKIFWNFPAFITFLLLFDAPMRILWLLRWYQVWSIFAPAAALMRLVVVLECLYRLFYRETYQERDRRENAIYGGCLLVSAFLFSIADHQLQITDIPVWIGHLRVITALLSVGTLLTARIFTWASPVRMMPGGYTHLWLLVAFWGANALGYALPSKPHSAFLLWDSIVTAIQCVCLTGWSLSGSHLIGIPQVLVAYRTRTFR